MTLIYRRSLPFSLAPALLALVAMAGCAPSTEIWVDVHTDLVPGEEVDRVVVRVDDGASRSSRIGTGEPFLEVARRFGPIATSAGRRRVTVDLQRGGAVVLSRTITGSFEGTVVLTVWLTRACVGVVCPTAGDPQATECDDGECVRPDCATSPDGCVDPRCTFDSECTAVAPSCASNACVGGRCTLLPDDALCASSEYCDPDVGCVTRSTPDAGVPVDAGRDAGPAPVDAGPPDAGPPPARLLRLGEGASSWATVTTSGDGPTAPILAAFASHGAGELVVFTDTELFVLRVSDHRWIARASRASEFPEIDGYAVVESATIAGIGPRILYVYSREGVHVYDWDAATRDAVYDQFIAFADFPAAEWGTPLAPAWWDVHGVYTRPDDRGGWVEGETADLCSGVPPSAHATYISWDGFGPAAMIVASYDYACFRFVDEAIFSSFEPFTLPGTPADPWSIDAAAWLDGLYLFVSE